MPARNNSGTDAVIPSNYSLKFLEKQIGCVHGRPRDVCLVLIFNLQAVSRRVSNTGTKETNISENLPEGMKKYRITASIVGTSITLVSSPRSSSARRRIMTGENCERKPVG